MKQNSFDNNLLAGKKVVITGAGRGIGLAVAKEMAECGATIVAHSGRAGTAQNLSGISDSVFEADLQDAQAVQNFVEFVQSKTSSIDVLINNADNDGSVSSRRTQRRSIPTTRCS